jgi:acyl CoA:acetate/3-ketoacid CoA transferase alpha subunit
MFVSHKPFTLNSKTGIPNKFIIRTWDTGQADLSVIQSLAGFGKTLHVLCEKSSSEVITSTAMVSEGID